MLENSPDKQDENGFGKTRTDALKDDWTNVVGRHSMMMALEPRFMFDAAVAATVDAVADQVDAHTSEGADASDAAETDAEAREHDDGASDGEFSTGAQMMRSFGFEFEDISARGIGTQAEEDPTSGMEIEIDGGGLDDDGAPLITTPENGKDPLSLENVLQITAPEGAGDGERFYITVTAEHGDLSCESDTKEGGFAEFQRSDSSSGNKMWTLHGTMEEINASLKTMTYEVDDHTCGVDTITIYKGNVVTEEGGADDPMYWDEFYIGIEHVNNLPTISGPDANAKESISFQEERESTIRIKDNVPDSEPKLITISDWDIENGLDKDAAYTIHLYTKHGELSYADDAFDIIDGIDPKTGYKYGYEFTGTFEEINAMLAAVSYKGDVDYSGPDSLKIDVWDGAMDTTKPGVSTEIAMQVTALNDDPTMSSSGDGWKNVTVSEGGFTILNKDMFNITDVDNVDSQHTVIIYTEIDGVKTGFDKGWLEIDVGGGVWRKVDSADLGIDGINGSGYRISYMDIIASKVRYVHGGGEVRNDAPTDGSDASKWSGFGDKDSFKFSVTDNVPSATDDDGQPIPDGSQQGWVRNEDGSIAIIDFTVNLTAVNDLPSLNYSNGTNEITIYEGQDWVDIKFGDIKDPDQLAGDSHHVKIVKLPDAKDGWLYWKTGVDEDGKAVYKQIVLSDSPGENQIALSEVNNGLTVADMNDNLFFTHSGNDGEAVDLAIPGATRDCAFVVKIWDDGGGVKGADGSEPADAVDNQYDFNIKVLPNNDNPEFADKTIDFTQDKPIVAEKDIGWGLNPLDKDCGLFVTDIDSKDSSISYKICDTTNNSVHEIYKETSPGSGKYQMLLAGDSFTQDDVNKGLIYYRYAGKTDGSDGVALNDAGTHYEGTLYLDLEVRDSAITAWARDPADVEHREGLTGGIGKWVADGAGGYKWEISTVRVELDISLKKGTGDPWIPLPETGCDITVDPTVDVIVGEGNEFVLTAGNNAAEPPTSGNLNIYYTETTGGVESHRYDDGITVTITSPTSEDDPGRFYIKVKVSDEDGGKYEYKLLNQYDNFTWGDLKSNNVVYRHSGDETFEDSVTFTVCGQSMEVTDIVLNIGVRATNDTPTVGGGTITVDEGREGWNHAGDPGYQGDSQGYLTDIGFTDSDGSGKDVVGPIDGDPDGYADKNDDWKFVIAGKPENGLIEIWDATIDPETGKAVGWRPMEDYEYADSSSSMDDQSGVYSDVDWTSTNADWLKEASADGENGNVKVFTKTDLDNKYIRYVHDGQDPKDGGGYTKEEGSFEDHINIIVNDGKGIALESQNADGVWGDTNTVTGDFHQGSLSAVGSVTVKINPVDDAPLRKTTDAEGNPLPVFTTPESGSRDPADANKADTADGIGTIITVDYLDWTDPDSSATQLQYTVEKPPTHGKLYYKNDDGDWVLLEKGNFNHKDIIDGRIKYVHDGSEHHGEDSFTFNLSDSSGNSTKDDLNKGHVFKIMIEPTNNAPTIKQDITSDHKGDYSNIYIDGKGGKNLGGIFKINDIDLTASEDKYKEGVVNAPVEVTITGKVTDGGKAYGEFSFSGDITGVTIEPSTNITGQIVLKGTIEAINKALESLVFTPKADNAKDLDVNGAVTITCVVNDLANGDVGDLVDDVVVKDQDYAREASSSFEVYVSTKNDSPEFSNTDWGALKTTEDSSAVAVRDGKGNPIHIIDKDVTEDFDRSTNETRIKVKHGELDVDLSSGVKKSVVKEDGEYILVLKGTLQQINDALETLTYKPDADWNGEDSLAILHNDHAKDSFGYDENGIVERGWDTVAERIPITVAPVNDAPELTAPDDPILIVGGTVGFTEGNKIQVDDSHDFEYGGDVQYNDSKLQVTLTLTGSEADLGTISFTGLTDAEKLLITTGENGETIIYGAKDAVNAILAKLTYTAPELDPKDSEDYAVQLHVQVDDLGNGVPLADGDKRDIDNEHNLSASKTIDMLISATNNPPVLTIGGGGVGDATSVDAVEDEKLMFTGKDALIVHDPDANHLPIKVTLTVDNGTLSVTEALRKELFSGKEGDKCTVKNLGSTKGGIIEIHATQDKINQILATLGYQGNANFNGQDTLKVVMDDCGNFCGVPDAEANVIDKSITINVKPINDAPQVNTVDGANKKTLTEKIDEDVDGNKHGGGEGAARVYDNNGDLISELFTNADPDKSAFNDSERDDQTANVDGSKANDWAGIVISNVDELSADDVIAEKGTWQYYDPAGGKDGKGGWVDIHKDNGSTLFLKADTRVRFQPAGNYHGAAPTLIAHLVDDSAVTDKTLPMPEHGKAVSDFTDIIENDKTAQLTRYSTGTVTLDATVKNVNDAPVVVEGGQVKKDGDDFYVKLPNVAEDDNAKTSTTNPGQTVNTIFGGGFDDTLDGSKANSLAGIVVVGNDADADKGSWQYWSGSDWVDIATDVSGPNGGQFIAADKNIRFAPAEDYNGPVPSLEVRLVDSSGGALTNGARATDIGDGGKDSRYSADTIEVKTAVDPRNDAPTIDTDGIDGTSGGKPYVEMNDMDEDAPLGKDAAQTVGDVFSPVFSDAKDGKGSTGTVGENGLLGVVIVDNPVNTDNGVWQYWDTTKGDWATVPSDCDIDNGFFLSKDTEIRFKPADNYNGTPPTLTVRLVDDADARTTTGVTTGNTVTTDKPDNYKRLDLTTLGVGEQSRYGAEDLLVQIKVKPVNDAPTVNTVDDANKKTLTEDIDEDVDGDKHNDGVGADRVYENNGNLISELFTNADPDKSAFKDETDDQTANAGGSEANDWAGIVISNVDDLTTEKGTWQYYNPAGGEDGNGGWVDIHKDNGSTLFLTADTRVRFQPADNYHGAAPTLIAHLVDDSAETDKTLPMPEHGKAVPGFDTIIENDRTAQLTRYSTGTVTLDATVKNTNDAPVVKPSDEVTKDSDGKFHAQLPNVAEDDNAKDSSTYLGQTVGSIFGDSFDDPVDGSEANSLAGIVVVGNDGDASKGSWQYWTGSEWQDIADDVSESNGQLIAADTAIRFAPVGDYNGPAPSLEVRLVDDSGGAITTGGQVTDVNNGGGTSRYSADTIEIETGVDPRNDAPTIDPDGIDGTSGGKPYVEMNDMDEDAPLGKDAAQTVGSVFGPAFSDSKDDAGDTSANNLLGVVIVDNPVDADKGVWQYWDTGKGDWATVPSDCDIDNGLFLSKDTEIRFKPADNYNGTPPTLTVRLVDDADARTTTGVTTGNTVTTDKPDNYERLDLTTLGAGEQSRYGAEDLLVQITVKPANDSPTRKVGESPIINDEGKFADGTTVISGLVNGKPGDQGYYSVSDIFGNKFADETDDQTEKDGGSADNFAGIVVTDVICNNGGSWVYSTDGGTTWSDPISPSNTEGVFIPADAVLKLVPADDWQTDDFPNVRLVVQLVDDSNPATLPEAGDAVAKTEFATDKSTNRYSDVNNSVELSLGHNQAPVVDGLEQVEVDSNGGPAPLAPNGVLTDTELDNFDDWDGATVTIERGDWDNVGQKWNPDPSDYDLFATTDNGPVSFVPNTDTGATDIVLGDVVVGTVTKNTGGTLEITFNDKADTDAVNEVLQNITYQNTEENMTDNEINETVHLVYTVNDGNGKGDDATTMRQGAGGDRQSVTDQTIVVKQPPSKPVAEGESETVNLKTGDVASGEVGGNVLANDSHTYGRELHVDNDPSGPQTYGTLTLDPATGEYTYVVDRDNPAVQGLRPGDTLTETITYTVEDANGKTADATLTIVINPPTDAWWPDPTTPPSGPETGDPADPGQPGLPGDKDPTDSGTVVDGGTDPFDPETPDKQDEPGNDLGTKQPSFPDLVDVTSNSPWPNDVQLIGNSDEKLALVNIKQDFALPEDLFIHTNPTEKLEFTATLEDGSPLPDWMEFNGDDFTIIATPPEGAEGSLVVVIHAQDEKGNRADATVVFKIGEDEDKQQFLADGDGEEEEVVAEKEEEVQSEAEGEETLAESAAETEEVSEADPTPDELLLTNEWLLKEAEDAEKAEKQSDAGRRDDGTHPGLQKQIAETGSSGLLAKARELVDSMFLM